MLKKLLLAALGMIPGLNAGPAAARDVLIEVEVLHVEGRMDGARLDALFADPRLVIEADYRPTRLIEGRTARRERTLPIGSRLFAIPQRFTLTGAQIERQGRLLRFRLPHAHPGHPEYYRLNAVELHVPDSRVEGRRQRGLRFHVMNEPPGAGAHETARLIDVDSAFKLGLRVQHRWSDAQGAIVRDPASCSGDVQSLGDGRYCFRRQHPLAGEFRALAPTVQSDPPSRPAAGQRSYRLREPYPEPLANWQMSRNHLVQLTVDGVAVERLSIYALQSGDGQCRRTRSYEALFANGRPVMVVRTIDENECGGPDSRRHEWVEASWLEDGSLAKWTQNRPDGTQVSWDGFLAGAPACGRGEVAPAAGEVEALAGELSRLRAAFLQP